MIISILTYTPSPYQVELFNELAQVPGIRVDVGYLVASDHERKWTGIKAAHHQYFLDGDEGELEAFKSRMEVSDLFVANFYNHPAACKLIAIREKSGRPWVFWGERPGFHRPMMGRIARCWKLRHLHRSQAPIWAMGKFGIEGYKAEFGNRRTYKNISYYSNLSRFLDIVRPRENAKGIRTILYSGSFIKRKGVDLLARAYASIASQFPHSRLLLMGFGPMESELAKILEPCAEQVEFLGFRDWKELGTVYSKADILCVPSRYDGWGLVVPEGLASGLPVIATDRMGSAIELVEEGRNGWIAVSGDYDSLESTIQRALSTPIERLMTMSDAARFSAMEHTLDTGVRRFIDAARDACTQWSKS